MNTFECYNCPDVSSRHQFSYLHRDVVAGARGWGGGRKNCFLFTYLTHKKKNLNLSQKNFEKKKNNEKISFFVKFARFLFSYFFLYLCNCSFIGQWNLYSNYAQFEHYTTVCKFTIKSYNWLTEIYNFTSFVLFYTLIFV